MDQRYYIYAKYEVNVLTYRCIIVVTLHGPKGHALECEYECGSFLLCRGDVIFSRRAVFV